MKVYGSISRLVSILFRQNSQDITLQPDLGTTYTAPRTISLPPGDADQAVVSADATQTLTNKTISGSSNTISNVSLSAGVTGTLPIANGGTNSSTSLSNNRIIVSSAGALVEEAAITANRALASNASGLPVASATTDTELGYVSGVTSAIQTQLNGKQATGSYITALTGDVTASGPGSAAATISAASVTAAKLGTVTDGITLDQSGAGSTLEVKAGGISDTQVSATAAIAVSKLAAGTNTYVLTTVSGTPTWSAPAASTTAYKTNWLTADGTTKTITHNLASNDLLIQIIDTTSGEYIQVNTMVQTSNNVLTLNASSAPGTSWRVLILAI